MALKFTQLQCKEVICISNGQRLGFVADVEVEVPEGNVIALVVPGQGKCFGLLGSRDDLLIPWRCIRRIGPDIILVDIKPEECRIPRVKGIFPFKP